MKPNPVATVTHVGQSQSEHRMQIDPLATVHLMSVLENLYSDPIKAVIREYSTNARDSHIDAGTPDRPIKVTLPTGRRLFFEVEDFGLGLNVDDLANVYSMYGRSTKRESDAVNGMLGLGCKSAFTYAQQFNVTAVKDGVKTLAIVLKDADGVGTIKILDTVGTDEPNGVKVSIPVRERHVNDFAEKARAFYSYWAPGTVLVDGEQPEALCNDPDGVWVGRADDEFGVDILVIPGGTASKIVMGNVAYPFRPDISGVAVVAWVPMGAVNFTPSREALHDTENTKTATAAVIDRVKVRLPEVLAVEIDALPPLARLHAVKRWRSLAPVLAKSFFAEFGTTPYLHYVDYYRPNIYRGRKMVSQRIDWFDLLNPQEPIILGYPHRTLTKMAQERMAHVFGQGHSNTWLFPTDAVGIDLSAIEGRGNIHTWDDILAQTPHVKPERKQRQRQAFAYNVYHHGIFERLTEFPAKATVLWTYTNDTHYVSKYPTAYVVELRSNQVDKFKRLFPSAQSAHEYHQAQREAVVAAISEDDRLHLTAQGFFGVGLMATVRADQVRLPVEDADFLHVVEVAMRPESKALGDYRRIIGNPTVGGVGLEAHSLVDEINRRYPLLATNHTYTQRAPLDAVLYINAKFQHIVSPKEAGK